MPKDFSNYYRKEELKSKAVKEGNQDQYNTLNPLDITQYKRQVQQSTLKYAARDGETLKQFTAKLELYMNLGLEKNERIHIDPPKGAWYQHRNPAGCFCCEDQNMIHYIFNILQILAHQYPKYIIK